LSDRDWLPDQLRRLAKTRALAAGEVLFRQGDRANAIFEVAQGRMRLIRHTIDNRPVTLHTARAGELFAEAALFADRYHCDAVAASESRVHVYPKRALLAAFRDDPALSARFMATLAHQIHALRSRLEGRNIRSARERILNYLVLAADAATRTVTLDGTLMDLASEIGVSHEVLYRTLAALAKDGIVARTRSTITLHRTRRL
jgi:CRP-like cAMP-binding protein